MTAQLIDQITQAFINALIVGAANLAVFSLAIATACATIMFAKEHGLALAYNMGLGEALASVLTTIVGLMSWYFLIVNLFPIATGALTTVINWGLTGTGTVVTEEMIRNPSFIMDAGLKLAWPHVEHATWLAKMWAAVKMVNHPFDMIAYALIVAAFLGITIHQVVLLVEFYLALMLSTVLVPWSIWGATAHIGEFGIGWLTGGAVRALISSAIIGVLVPLFELVGTSATPGTTILGVEITLYASVMKIAASWLFFWLAWTIPARAALIASRGMALGLHGGMVAASAMGMARYGMMVQGISAGASRAMSTMVARRHGYS